MEKVFDDTINWRYIEDTYQGTKWGSLTEVIPVLFYISPQH